MKSAKQKPRSSESQLREKIHEIIFEADTGWGLVFDVFLLIAIACSVTLVCLETVDSFKEKYGQLFFWAEWVFTVLFSIEYILRLYCVQRPVKYATSFFGVIDLLAILPTYIGALFVNAPNLAVVRAFRLLRVFRVFKLIYFMKEADDLGRAIVRARAKIIVFLGVVVVAITVAGTLMYEIENWGDGRTVTFANDDERNARTTALKNELRVAIDANDFTQIRLSVRQLEDLEHEYRKSKFTNIPESMYWATVTMTTVGYGDIVPTTTAGKFVAAILILLGYSLIIVPTGFVSAEFMESRKALNSTQTCRYCMLEGHDMDAIFCKQCGHELNGSED